MVTPAQAKEIIHEWMFASKPALETGAKAIDALRDLASQVESLQADAERYRWLRTEAQYSEESPVCVSNGKTYGHAQEILSEDELDVAIDEARKQS